MTLAAEIDSLTAFMRSCPGSRIADVAQRVAPILSALSPLTPAQIDYLIEHHANLAEDDEQTARAVAAGRLEVWDFGGSDMLPEAETAKAHRALVAILEALRGER